MKKFLMTLVAAFGLAVSANAQTYVGGGFSIFLKLVTTSTKIGQLVLLSVGKVPIKAMKRALK